MSRSKSSTRWLKEHFKDPFVKAAQQQGFRSRAAYKLLGIQEQDRILRPGMVVVDLGAAPGGWSQVAKDLVGQQGRVIALDILPLEPIASVTFIQGDFTEAEIYDKLRIEVGDVGVDVVLSDMAPNMSGIPDIDQARSLNLAEQAFEFVTLSLKPGGAFVIKLFQGAGFDAFLKELRRSFDSVSIRKPDASRQRSREIYIVAKGYCKVD